jgi:hypothetical protein
MTIKIVANVLRKTTATDDVVRQLQRSLATPRQHATPSPAKNSDTRLNPKIFTPVRHSRPGPPIDGADCVKRIADTRPLKPARVCREAFPCQFLLDCC